VPLHLPSPPFTGEVGKKIFFMPLGGVCIYRNATGATNRPLVGFVFTKITLNATNRPQILFCEP